MPSASLDHYVTRLKNKQYFKGLGSLEETKENSKNKEKEKNSKYVYYTRRNGKKDIFFPVLHDTGMIWSFGTKRHWRSIIMNLVHRLL